MKPSLFSQLQYLSFIVVGIAVAFWVAIFLVIDHPLCNHIHLTKCQEVSLGVNIISVLIKTEAQPNIGCLHKIYERYTSYHTRLIDKTLCLLSDYDITAFQGYAEF